MEDKKTVKVSLGTVICIFIIILLIIALVCMYLYYNRKDNNTNTNNNTIVQEQDTSNETKDDDIEVMKALVKLYILTDFGPQDNMEMVTVNSYKEITSEEYFAKVPGAPWTEEEKEEFLKKNPNVTYGYCTYTIELIDANSLVVEGSKPAYQELNGNTFKSEAVFTMDNTTQEITFATTYGFGNKSELSKSEIQSVLGLDDAFFCIENIKKSGEDYIITAYMLEKEPRVVSDAEYQDLKNGKEIKFRNQKWVLKDGDNNSGILQSGDDSLSLIYSSKKIGNIAGVAAELSDYSNKRITFKVSKNIPICSFWVYFKYDENGKIKAYSVEDQTEISDFKSLSFERLEEISEGCQGTYDECKAYVKDGVVGAIKIYEK